MHTRHSVMPRIRYVFQILILSGFFAAAYGGEASPEMVVDDSAGVVEAKPVAPDAPPRNQELAKQEKKLIPTSTRRPAENTAATTRSPWGGLLLLGLYIIALASLLYGVLAIAKRYLPGSKQLFASPAIEVLGKTHLDPRRYMALVRIGQKVIVVGVSPDNITTLTEVDDDKEVLDILSSTKPAEGAGSSLFQKLFQKQVEAVGADEDKGVAKASAQKLEDDYNSLQERVRALREQE